jgi:drug/metabolite transporter (DMT)-like permease
MFWFLLLSMHLLGLVGYTLLLRKSALATTNKYALAAMMQTFIFLPSLVFLFMGKVNFRLGLNEYIYLVGSSFMISGLHITTIKALQNTEASIFTIIYNLRLLLTTILGFVFLNERPPLLQIVGGMIIFASILLLNIHRNKAYKNAVFSYAIIATLWMSFHAVLEKYNVVHAGFESYMFIGGVGASCMLWAIAFRNGARIKTIGSHLDKGSLLLFLFRFMSAWAYVYALKLGSLAVTNYVSGMSVALIVLFGVLFLKERNYIRQKIFAVSVAFVGLTIILISRILA